MMSEQVKLENWQIGYVRVALKAIHEMPWDLAPQGEGFWRAAANTLCGVVTHGTSDGKPWVEPVKVPTDEDAKSRPTVMVRDYDSDGWSMQTLVAVGRYDSPVRFATISKSGNVNRWRQCRFPTELEADTVLTADTVGEAIEREIETPEVDGDGWQRGVSFWSLNGYKSPIPTDEDARSRPKVMVRRSDGGTWYPKKLVAVGPDTQSCKFFAASSNGMIDWWEQCRFPIPNE